MNCSIVMIVQNFYAIDARVRRYAEALADKGYKVDVIAVKYKPERFVYKLNNVTVYQIPVSRKRNNLLNYVMEYGFFFLLTSLWLTILFIKRKYKIIHVHNMPDFLVFSALIPKFFGAKVIIDIHDPFPELYSVKFKSGVKKVLRKLLFLEERISLKFADHIITSTKLIKFSLITKGFESTKISTVLNIPDSSLFNPEKYSGERANRGNRRFTLLFAGTIAERNGLGIVVKALPLLRDEVPEICYRVLGQGEYLEDLKKLVDDLRLGEMVEFKGLIPLEEIPPEILKAQAVVWFPDQSEFMDMVLSVKVMEALRMGIPVITTKTRCHAYYYDEGELIFAESSEISEVVRTIIDLYTNYERYKPSTRTIKKIAAKFSWEREKVNYLQLITRLIDKSVPSAHKT